MDTFFQVVKKDPELQASLAKAPASTKNLPH